MTVNDFNEKFVSKHTKSKLIHICLDYYETIKAITFLFVIEKEEDLKTFLQCYFEEIKNSYLSDLERENLFLIEKVNYIVKSQEDIDANYEGNYYYALK